MKLLHAESIFPNCYYFKTYFVLIINITIDTYIVRILTEFSLYFRAFSLLTIDWKCAVFATIARP